MSDEEKLYCVYKHTNKINGKMYIGQTCQKPQKRWSNGKHYETSTYFNNAIQKYGWDNFEHEIIATGLTLNEANSLEEKLIIELELMNSDKGYNLRSGGKNNLLSKETKRKISESNKNKKVSEATRKKMSEAQRGKVVSEETKKKLSEIAKQRTGNKNGFYGKKHSEETRQKIGKASKNQSKETRLKQSEAHKGVKNHGIKPIDQYDKNGNFIKHWDYIQLAANELKICASHISVCAKGTRKSAGGFVWRCQENEQDKKN